MKIQEFSFENFWSFQGLQTLNMGAAKIKSSNPELDINNILPINNDIGILKSKAIYGANSSGKSNITKALFVFLRIIKDSVKDEKILTLIDPFRLSEITENEPSFFQMVFYLNNIKYRYGFEADEKVIKSEWLFSTPGKREQTLFIRENNKIIEINKKNFDEGSKFISLSDGDNDNQIFRDNSLFLSSLSSFGFAKESKKIINAFSKISIISGLGHKGMYNLAGDSLNDSDKKEFILNFLKNADTGISDIQPVEISDELSIERDDDSEIKKDKIKKMILSTRAKYDQDLNPRGFASFSFSLHESEGTRKMFELSPFIYKALTEEAPLIIDEFDSRFHPLLTKKIVELFNSERNNSSQLIFITHDTNLLSSDILRRDQIDFVEKDKYGASHLYTLIEIKGIRNDASFEKDYIQGKYGAIPFLGNFNHILTLINNAEEN